MHPSCIRCRVNPTNGLVKQVETESKETCQCIVRRETLSTLILVIDYALKRHGASPAGGRRNQLYKLQERVGRGTRAVETSTTIEI